MKTGHDLRLSPPGRGSRGPECSSQGRRSPLGDILPKGEFCLTPSYEKSNSHTTGLILSSNKGKKNDLLRVESKTFLRNLLSLCTALSARNFLGFEVNISLGRGLKHSGGYGGSIGGNTA